MIAYVLIVMADISLSGRRCYCGAAFGDKVFQVFKKVMQLGFLRIPSKGQDASSNDKPIHFFLFLKD